MLEVTDEWDFAAMVGGTDDHPHSSGIWRAPCWEFVVFSWPDQMIPLVANDVMPFGLLNFICDTFVSVFVKLCETLIESYNSTNYWYIIVLYTCTYSTYNTTYRSRQVTSLLHGAFRTTPKPRCVRVDAAWVIHLLRIDQRARYPDLIVYYFVYNGYAWLPNEIWYKAAFISLSFSAKFSGSLSWVRLKKSISEVLTVSFSLWQGRRKLCL